MVDNTIALRGQSLQAPNLLGMANTAAQTKNTLAQTEIDQSQEQRAQYAGAVQQSRDALAYVNSPEQYLAWHEANHSNPVLGPMLSKMGVTAEQSRAKIMDELQRPGGLERLIQQSAAGADKISGIMQGRLNQMSADRNTAAANARKAQEMAQISGGAMTAPAPANALAPAATAMPVAPPRNTLAAPPGSPAAMENLYAPALANANVAATTPFSASQGGGDAAVMNRVNRLQELYMNGNQEAGRQLKILVDGLKRDKDLGIGVDGNIKLSEQLVPVGKNVFNRTTGQFIQPPPAKTPAEVAKQVKTEKGQENVDQILGKMFKSYEQLNKAKAIPSSKNTMLQNIQSYGAASMPQIGRAVGSKEQGIRDTITQIRPALIQGIKNATGMSAQEMNSNVELQIQLEAASDPALSIESNIAALNNISKLYGLGTEYQIPDVGGAPETPQSSVPPAAVEYLRANPNLAADFEAEFNLPAGSAQQYLGGGNGR